MPSRTHYPNLGLENQTRLDAHDLSGCQLSSVCDIVSLQHGVGIVHTGRAVADK